MFLVLNFDSSQFVFVKSVPSN